MRCPGSIQLLSKLELPDTDEADYQIEGTCAHAGLAFCFEQGIDAWEIVGHTFGADNEGVPVEFTSEMASAVQEMLDACRADYTNDGNRWVEFLLCEPRIHPLFMGTVDHAYVDGDTLIVSDFKYGVGIPVDVAHNPQLLYYAYGLLQLPDCKDVLTIKLRVTQPRAFHPDGKVREWVTDTDLVRRWAAEELLPAMLRTEESGALMPGDHCRFCPAKLVCPAMRGLFAAVAGQDAADLKALDDSTLDSDYRLVEAVQHYRKALGEEMMRRLQAGRTFQNAKLVDKKADRVWKAGAKERFQAEFGAQAFSEPVLLTPPQMERVDPRAKALVKEWAYTPKTGFTVAPATDKRTAVKTETATEMFAHMTTRIKDQ